MLPNPNYFFRINNKVLFTTYFNDTIWDITTMTKNPAIIFSLENKLMDYDKFVNLNNKNHDRAMQESEKMYKLDIVESDSLIVAYMANYQNMDTKIYSYNKVNKTILNYGRARIYDDLHGSHWLSLYAIQNNKIICFEDYNDLKKI